MDNASLLTKLSNVQVAYADEILHACAKRLQAGEDAEDTVVAALEALALERARLIEQGIALVKQGNSLVQGKPLTEVFAEDEMKRR